MIFGTVCDWGNCFGSFEFPCVLYFGSFHFSRIILSQIYRIYLIRDLDRIDLNVSDVVFNLNFGRFKLKFQKTKNIFGA